MKTLCSFCGREHEASYVCSSTTTVSTKEMDGDKAFIREDPLYTLSDLEQARKQGAEDERARIIDMLDDNPIAVPAIRIIEALGPIGETHEETEKRVRRETVEQLSYFIAMRLTPELCERIKGWIESGRYPLIISAALKSIIEPILLDAIEEGKE